MAVRLALWIPLLVALTSLPRIIVGTAQGPSAFLTEDWRLWIYIVAPAAFAIILAYVTSLYAAWLAGPARLPRLARAAIEINRVEPMPEAGLVSYSATLPRFRRVRLALRTIAEASILLFLAVPMPAILLGYLFKPGTYRLEEALVVGICAAAEIAWVTLILFRYLVAERLNG